MAYNAADVESSIKGASFPATGTQLAGVAALNNAPLDLLDALRSWESRQFESAGEVTQAVAEQHSG